MSLAMPLMENTPLSRPIIRVRFEPEFQDVVLIEQLHQGRFSAHGETHAIGAPVNWLTNPSDDIEWHILLHKFFHAPVLVQAWLDSGQARHIELLDRHVRSWVAQVPPGHIAADVTGRRIRNWVYALSLLDGAFPALGKMMSGSICEQVAWLKDNLHPSRNHRTLELFAIYIAGVFLGDDEWADSAMAELLANARSDFLPDGAHVELSSHYHCIALRNFVEAIQLADDNGLVVPSELRDIVARASHFAQMLHKPDGNIPALSDADVGDYREMLGDVRAPKLIETFPDAGYVIMRDNAAVAGDPMGYYLVLDCGAIGAGNHGHLDCLSFEFAALGRSMVVDPGRYSYHEKAEPNWRAAFRQTRAHNLVQVDGLEQTWYRQGPKRMKVDGPSPDAQIVAIEEHGDWRQVHVRCESAEYPVVHDRHVVAHDDGWWVIYDRLTSGEPHHYEALFQLEPAAFDHAHVVENPDGERNILAPDLLIMPRAGPSLDLSFEQGWVSPRYGEKHRAPRLVCGQRGKSIWFATLLLPFQGALPELMFSANENGFAVAGRRYLVRQAGDGGSC
jgi:hypothetical protein